MTRVRAEDVETGAVSRRTIRPGAVGRDELDERLRPGGGWWQGAIGRGMIAPGGVIAGNIAPGAVQAPDLDDNSVTAPKIRDGSVEGPKIADGAVTGPKVPAGALGARELADGSLTLPKFQVGQRPVRIVETVPADLADFIVGDAVVNTTDGKVYRLTSDGHRWPTSGSAQWPTSGFAEWPAATWDAQVDTTDLRGLIEEGQIGQGAVVAGTVAANAIGATELAAIYVEVDKWIRSFNWDPGVAGWAIDGDGNAEFNDVTIRGGLLVGGTLQTSALVSADYQAGSSGWALDPAGNTELNDVTIRGSVLVGGTITAVDLKSDNYQAGTAGWALDGNGNAELNDATFRGNIKASSVTSGQLVSSNYVAGSAGWALDANGNAEFNDATFRGSTVAGGTISGATFETTGNRGVRIDGAGESVEFGWSGGASDARIRTTGDFRLQIGAGVHIEMQTDRVLFPDGTATSPAVTFTGDQDTGMYRWNTNAIGFAANGNERVVIGASGFIAHGVYEVTTAGAANVNVDANGRLERSTSSARYKRDIAGWAPDGQVLTVTPSTFVGSRGDADGRVFDGRRSLGLIAEDVAVRFPWAVVRDGQGRPDAVDWNAITAALLGELARTNARVEALEAA